MKKSQKQVWEKFWQSQNYIDVDLSVKEYHQDIKKIVERLPNKHTSIEIGSGIGITSLILSDTMDVTLLDFDAHILQEAAMLFEQQHKKADFICCDMFNLDSVANRYDVVFNSGVLEHYTAQERAQLLKEYKKVLKPDGVMIIAVPNHYCIPYKLGYIALRMLGLWKFPKEYAIKNIVPPPLSEVQEIGLVCRERIIASNNLIEDSIKNKILKAIYICLKKVFKFQGYLRIFILQNKEVFA